jgi:2-oxoglutarate ferredoxin oxidoreductase subunit beta
VTFNDHDGSTKSYAYARDHDEPLGEIDFVPFFEDIAVEYEPGTAREVRMHDGSTLVLRKLAADYDPKNKIDALKVLHEAAARGEFVTGIIYLETEREDFVDLLGLPEEPLAFLPLDRVRPPKAALDEIMESLR